MVKILRENNELKTIPIECVEGATLLSVDEAENLLTIEERKCTYKERPCWWWLQSPGLLKDYVSSVSCAGSVDRLGRIFDRDDIYVRPILEISTLNSSNLQIGDSFEFGGYKFNVISNSYALCEEAIGQCAFREGGRSKDANVYEKSDVKKYVDNWFNMSMQDAIDIANNRMLDSKLWDAMDLGF